MGYIDLEKQELGLKPHNDELRLSPTGDRSPFCYSSEKAYSDKRRIWRNTSRGYELLESNPSKLGNSEQ